MHAAVLRSPLKCGGSVEICAWENSFLGARKGFTLRARPLESESMMEARVRHTFCILTLMAGLAVTGAARAQPSLEDYLPIPIDPNLPPLTFPRAEIEDYLDAAISDGLQNQDRIRWGHISGRRVEVSRADEDIIHIDLDLAANAKDPLPDPEVDVDLYVRIRSTGQEILAELVDMAVDVNYPTYVDLLTLGVADTVATLAELTLAPEIAIRKRAVEHMVAGFRAALPDGAMFPLPDSVFVDYEGNVRLYFDTWRGKWAPVGTAATCTNGFSGIDGRVELVNGELVITVATRPWSNVVYTTIQTWTRIPGQGDVRGPTLSTAFAPETVRVPAPAGVTHLLCDAISR